jgi:N-glycosylase/DNA lyase
MMANMKHLECEDFSLKHTVESGQLFRFVASADGYLINSADRLFFVRQNKDDLFFDGDVDKGFIRYFFRLDEDHAATIRSISKDEHIRRAVEKYRGIRIMRQDTFECTMSFICSSASNIPRIQKNVSDIARLFGEKRSAVVCGRRHEYYSFPRPGVIKDKKKLSQVRLGYREDFILETDRLLTDDFISGLKRSDYQSAKKQLMSLHGVGEKVADCISLFSLGHLNAFPVDTWVTKVMLELYLHHVPKNGRTPRKIREFAEGYFGDHAGYAQQYLFYSRRNEGKRSS